MDTKVTASQLRARMHVRGVTQQQLAEKAGLDQPNVSAILNGRRAPQPETQRRLARAIIKLDLDREPEPDPNEPVFEL